MINLFFFHMSTFFSWKNIDPSSYAERKKNPYFIQGRTRKKKSFYAFIPRKCWNHIHSCMAFFYIYEASKRKKKNRTGNFKATNPILRLPDGSPYFTQCSRLFLNLYLYEFTSYVFHIFKLNVIIPLRT